MFVENLGREAGRQVRGTNATYTRSPRSSARPLDLAVRAERLGRMGSAVGLHSVWQVMYGSTITKPRNATYSSGYNLYFHETTTYDSTTIDSIKDIYMPTSL